MAGATIPIVYRVDAEGHITYVNESWTDFAAENGAGGRLRPDDVVGRPIWDFIANDAVKELYFRLFDRARRGHRSAFPYRCDASGIRREFSLEIERTGAGEVEIRSTARSVSPYPLTPLRLTRPAAGSLVRMCGWCHAIAVDGERWWTLERAMDEWELMHQVEDLRFSHGICPDCEERFFA